MQVEIYSTSGQSTGRYATLPDAIFAIEPNQHAIYLAVKQYLANQRQGTHKSKEKSEVSGSTRKLKRQKGTGGARAGSIKNPLFVGGARIFGPRPRTYDMKLNKKLKQLARNSAFSAKAQNSQLIIIEDFDFDAPKTKDYTAILKNLGLNGKKSLLVLDSIKTNVLLSARNVPGASVHTVEGLNTYAILNGGTLVLSESAVSKFNS